MLKTKLFSVKGLVPILLSLTSLVITTNASGQNVKKLNHWYFGYSVTLEWDCDGNYTFATDKHPTIDLGGPGVATSQDGDFLFYVCASNKNGQTAGIYDRTGNFMQLQGGGDADMPAPQMTANVGGGAQCIQVSENIWFVGFANAADNYYSFIDMSLPGNGTAANPAGEVIEHNTPTTLPANGFYVRHDNGKDYWRIAIGTTQAEAWLLTETGLSAPVVSTVAFLPPALSGINRPRLGSIAMNPGVDKLAYAYGVADFDNATGMFSNVQYLPHQSHLSSGNAFTADCRYLVRMEAQNRFQGGHATIVRYETAGLNSSSVPYDTIYDGKPTGNNASWGGGFYLHNDGNMYFKNGVFGDLSIIRNPSSANPTVEENGILLGQARTGSWNQFPDRTGSWGTGGGLNFPGGYAVEVRAENIDTTLISSDCSGTVYEFLGEYCNLNVTSEEWFFGDGSSSTQNNPQHTYTAAGTYTVQYVVRNDNTCSKWNTDTLTMEIIIDKNAVGNASFTYPSATYCPEAANDLPTITGTPGGIFTASSPGLSIDAATGELDFSASQPGRYTVKYELTGSCPGQETFELEILDAPTITLSNLENCEGEAYAINFPGEGTSLTTSWTNLTGTDIGFGLTGTGNIGTYTATSPSGSSETVNIEVIPTSMEGCVGLPENFEVLVETKPQVSFSADRLEGCEPLEVIFTNASPAGVSCLWDFGDGNTSTDCGPTSHTFQAGLHDVSLTVVSSSGCKATETYQEYIKATPRPIAEFSFLPEQPTRINPLVNFSNLSKGANAYDWDFGDGVGSSTDVNPSYEYSDIPKTYMVTLWAYNANDVACRDSITKELIISESLTYFVPNTFTPNGDGDNQTFKPVFTTGYDPNTYHLTIFDRWGEIMFESYNIETGWNGSYGNLGVVQDGIYVWKIEFKDSENKAHEVTGHVTLLK